MKDDLFIILHLVHVMWEWVYDVVEIGMEGVHFEFFYELLCFKKGHG